MPGFNGELYFDRRLPVTHLPTVFCTVFIILFGCLVARGIREISVVYFSLIWAKSDGRYGEISRFGTLL